MLTNLKSRRVQRVIAMTVFYLLVAFTTLEDDLDHDAAFLAALGVVTVIIGVVLDRADRGRPPKDGE